MSLSKDDPPEKWRDESVKVVSPDSSGVHAAGSPESSAINVCGQCCKTSNRDMITFSSDDPWNASTVCRECLEYALKLLQNDNA